MSKAESGSGHLLTPGTWLAEVSRDRTLNIVKRLNLVSAGLGHVRDRLLLGVDADGQEPTPSRPRADTVSDTTKLALDDLILLRDITTTTIHAVAAAAIDSGQDREVVLNWAKYDADDRALVQGVAGALDQDEGGDALVDLVDRVSATRKPRS